VAKAKTVKSASGDEVLEERTIRVLSFPYRQEVPNPAGDGTFFQNQEVADRGDVVFLHKADIQRGESLDAFVMEGAAPAASPAGDGTEEVFVSEMDDEELEAWIREDQPTVDDTVGAAGTDADLARRLLDAEARATDGDPRKGVITGLGEVIKRAGV